MSKNICPLIFLQDIPPRLRRNQLIKYAIGDINVEERLPIRNPFTYYKDLMDELCSLALHNGKYMELLEHTIHTFESLKRCDINISSNPCYHATSGAQTSRPSINCYPGRKKEK